MSFYRNVIVAVATMGLATAVFAADESTNATQSQAGAAQQVAANDTTTTTTVATSTSTTQDKVDLNKATPKELMKVKGLNKSHVKAIMSYRKKNGNFTSVDQLKDVKGFKKMDEKTMKEIQDQLTVG